MKHKKKYDERHQEIILTARSMFFKKGIGNSTVDAIVSEIGVAKGLFYYYFPSKKDLILAVVSYEFIQIETQLFTLINNPDLSFIQKLSKFIDLEIQLLDSFGPKVFRNMNLYTCSVFLEEVCTNTHKLNLRLTNRLIEFGKKENLIHIRYSAEILLTFLNEYSALKKHFFSEHNTLLRMIEEGLHLSKGCLQSYSTSS